MVEKRLVGQDQRQTNNCKRREADEERGVTEAAEEAGAETWEQRDREDLRKLVNENALHARAASATMRCNDRHVGERR